MRELSINIRHKRKSGIHIVYASLAVLVISLLLSSCSNTIETLDGYWITSEVVFSDSLYLNTHSEFKTVLEEQLSQTRFQLNKDGTGTSDFVGDVFDITWELNEDGYVKVYLEDGSLYTELYNASKKDSLILDVQTDDYLAQVILKRSPQEATFDSESRSLADSTEPAPEVQGDTIETDFYSIELPTSWTDRYYYDLYTTSVGEICCDFWMDVPDKEGLYIATLSLFPDGLDYTGLRSYSYLGTLVSPDETYHVISYYSVGEKEPLIETMIDEFKAIVIPSLRAKPGYTLELTDSHLSGMEDDTDTDNDIPYIAAWADKLDVSFSPSGLYTDVTNGCLTSDGTANSVGVGAIYGAYALPNIRYYSLDDGHQYRYYGVQDGTVVAYLDDVSDKNHNVHYYVGEEFDSTPPKTVKAENCCYFEWELVNGYLVLETVRNDYSSPYTEWWVQKVMYYKSRDMCYWLYPNIAEWAKEQNAQAAAEKAEISEKKNLSEDEQATLLQEMCRLGTYASDIANGYEIAFLSIDRSDITLNIRKTAVIDKTMDLSVTDLRYYLDTDNAPYFIVEATDGSEIYKFTIQDNGFQAAGFSFIVDIDYSFNMVDYYQF